MLVLKFNFRSLLSVLIALSIAMSPLIQLSAHAQGKGGAAPVDRVDSVTRYGSSEMSTSTVTVESVAELKEVVEEAKRDGARSPSIHVFNGTKDVVDTEALKNDVELVQQIINGEGASQQAPVIEYTPQQRKSLLQHLGDKYASLKAKLTRIVDNVSDKHELAYRLSFASVRAVGLFGAITYSYYVIMGLPADSALMAAGVASSATFIIQNWGSKYLEILGDPHAYSKFYKWLRKQQLRSTTSATDEQITQELKKIDKNKFLQWLSKQETLVSYSLYLLTEYPIVLAVTLAAFGLPSDSAKFFSDAALISLSALLSQGIIDSALAYGRRGQLQEVLKSVFPKIESDLAAAESEHDKDLIIKQYERRLDGLRASGVIVNEAKDWPQLKEASQKRNIVEFLMNFKMLVIAILANSAAFLAGGDLFQFVDLVSSGKFEDLTLAQKLGFGGILTMFTGGLGYKFALHTKYDSQFKSKMNFIQTNLKKLRQTCSQLLSDPQ